MRTRTRFLLWGLAGSAVIGLGFITFVAEFTTEMIWVDPVTGVVKTQSRHTVLPDGPERIQRAELMDWVEAREGHYKPSWKQISANGSNLFGGRLVYRCSPAPPAYMLSSSSEVLAAFVSGAEPAEIEALIDRLRSGTDEEQEAAVKEAHDRGLELWTGS